MPSFILKSHKCNPLDYRRKTTLYSKKVYSPAVKVSEWENYQNIQPLDNNPFCTEGANLHYSHYNHFGSNYDVKWSTTTGAMLKEVFEKKDLEDNPNPNCPLVNVYTTIMESCNKEQPICYETENQNFLTTMQHSYQPPYPYKLRRLAMPKIPHLLYRRLVNHGMCKFLDDDYILHTERLQTNKSSRFVSYNPCTGYYTDGISSHAQNSNKCVDNRLS